MLVFHFGVFGPLLAGKWVRPTKNVTHRVGLLGQPLCRNHVLERMTQIFFSHDKAAPDNSPCDGPSESGGKVSTDAATCYHYRYRHCSGRC